MEIITTMNHEDHHHNHNQKGNHQNNNNEEQMIMILHEKMRQVIETSAVVVLSLEECCMCHVVKHLLFGLGVAPTVVELDSSSGDIATVLRHLTGRDGVALPAVFVGGKLLGGIESLMASHINGSLVPLLKQAGALWL